MQSLMPPVCLLLALAMLIAGFALLAVEAPEPNVDLHRALTSGDDAYAEVAKAHLARRQFARKVLLASLFGGSIVLTISAFLVMRPPR